MPLLTHSVEIDDSFLPCTYQKRDLLWVYIKNEKDMSRRNFCHLPDSNNLRGMFLCVSSSIRIDLHRRYWLSIHLGHWNLHLLPNSIYLRSGSPLGICDNGIDISRWSKTLPNIQCWPLSGLPNSVDLRSGALHASSNSGIHLHRRFGLSIDLGHWNMQIL